MRNDGSLWRIAAGISLAATCLGWSAHAQQKPERVTVLRGTAVLDPASGRIQPNGIIIVQGDRILAAGPGATPPPNAQVIDLSGYTVLPGLIDAHTHVMLQPEDERWPPPIVYKSQSFRTIQGVAAARKELEGGFTTLRDLDSEGAGFADVALRDAINRGIVPGPRLFVSTYAISITAGHMNLTDINPDLDLPDQASLADTQPRMIQEVRRQVKGGADWIKIYATGTLRHIDPATLEPISQLSLEDVQALVAEARRWRKDVAAHAYGGEGAKNAIRGGVRSIEHGMFLDDETIGLLKEHQTFWCPTLIAYIDGVESDKTDFTRRIVARHKESFQKALHSGVKIVFGTDVGAMEHGTQARELEVMVSYGMTPIDAIRSATTVSADLLRMAGQVGTLTKGAYADVIAVDGNPLQDVKALQRVRFVMKAGQVYKQPTTRETKTPSSD
jgi:imidazolonepropionase-like amidohydrolase